MQCITGSTDAKHHANATQDASARYRADSGDENMTNHMTEADYRLPFMVYLQCCNRLSPNENTCFVEADNEYFHKPGKCPTGGNAQNGVKLYETGDIRR